MGFLVIGGFAPYEAVSILLLSRLTGRALIERQRATRSDGPTGFSNLLIL